MISNRTKTGLSLFLISLGLIAGVTLKDYLVKAAGDAPAQDVMNLDRRVSTLEQRLYGIESNISRLEQQILMSQRPSPLPSQPQTQRDPEVDLLRQEVELLKGRVRELECGMVRLDERTLPAAKRHTASKDPCRQNPNAPVQLSMRP